MDSAKLLPLEKQRYQRQMILPEVGLAGQQKLKHSRVLVVGAGGLGCPILTYLVAAGVGTIKIADADLVDRTNLHRQPLYGEAAVGRLKVEEATRILKESNPTVDIISLSSRMEAENVREILSDVEIVVDGSDNFATKYLLNDGCVELGKSLVSGSIFCFEGQLSVFNSPLANGNRGPTYRCLFPEPLPVGVVPSCADAGVLGVLPGVIGSLQATETLKLILGIGEILSGRMLVFDALRMAFSEICFERNEEIASHTHIRPASYYHALAVSCSVDAGQISVRELKSRLEQNEELLLIDVREPAEKEEFDLGGELIPSGVLLSQSDRIPRDRPVVLYCRSGVRSKKGVAQLRREHGFSNLLNLEGGILAWQLEIGSDDPR